jgi:predicted nucleic acid-binding protein
VKYLVDANVLSEPTRPHPHVGVVHWLRRNQKDVVVDPIILGEIKFGIERTARGRRRKALERWFAEGVQALACVPWDAATGLRWGRLLADLRAAGNSIPIKDSLIASTALVHDLIVVTRNTRDFERAGARVLDPFV